MYMNMNVKGMKGRNRGMEGLREWSKGEWGEEKEGGGIGGKWRKECEGEGGGGRGKWIKGWREGIEGRWKRIRGKGIENGGQRAVRKEEEVEIKALKREWRVERGEPREEMEVNKRRKKSGRRRAERE